MAFLAAGLAAGLGAGSFLASFTGPEGPVVERVSKRSLRQHVGEETPSAIARTKTLTQGDSQLMTSNARRESPVINWDLPLG